MLLQKCEGNFLRATFLVNSGGDLVAFLGGAFFLGNQNKEHKTHQKFMAKIRSTNRWEFGGQKSTLQGSVHTHFPARTFPAHAIAPFDFRCGLAAVRAWV